MRELIYEIFCSMRQNKLRTALTGFSVAWGIFMLIILLGSGNGLKNGAMSNFGTESLNTMTVSAGVTQLPYKGYNSFRRIKIKYEDVEFVASEVPNIICSSPERSIWGAIKNSSNNAFARASIMGVSPFHITISGDALTAGRFINKTDMDLERKVVVLTKYGVDVLFGGASPIDKDILVDNIVYKVVGVINRKWDNFAIAYIPITTSLALYKSTVNPEVSYIDYEITGVNNIFEAVKVEEQIRKSFAKRLSFSPDDMEAVRISNGLVEFMQIQMIFSGIEMFIWIIGLGTLMAGIVGVSNIMLVTVRERTSEFGIRKSLGATPLSIVQLILIESISITLIFGYIGIVLGTFVMEVVNIVIESTPAEPYGSTTMFLNPTIDLGVAISATVVLVISGAIAGYIPARRAARLKTIDAMRYNK